MAPQTAHKKVRSFSLVALGLLGASFAPSASAGSVSAGRSCGGHGTELYVPPPNDGALAQVKALKKAHKRAEAAAVSSMIESPQAVWFTQGTPKSVKRDVRKVVQDAHHSVPVLVAYNLPFRDCAQFSAGGAVSVAEYIQWIDAFAAGIGNSEAIVVVEPDGLGIIPWYKQFRGLPSEGGYEWCQPAEADPATAADDRFAMLQHAVQVLKALPNTKVYLDGTHSSWLGSGDAAHRLTQAGVSSADGFFVNASNYRFTEHLAKYGTWISQCLWFATDDSSWGKGHFDWCASQYYPANPNDFSTWGATDDWYANNVLSQAYPGDEAVKHFVIDTSRNGKGPWTPSASYPDAQDWCNPPGRGLGLEPTTETGTTLIDAYLWLKIPGESDGECTRGLGPAGTTVDPEWSLVDPAAGAWFPEMALDLVRNAVPAMTDR